MSLLKRHILVRRLRSDLRLAAETMHWWHRQEMGALLDDAERSAELAREMADDAAACGIAAGVMLERVE